MMLVRRQMLMKPITEHWDYEYYANEDGLIIPETFITIPAGKKFVIAWDTDEPMIYTNRYVWRCAGATLDGGGQYAFATMARMNADGYAQKDRKSYTITRTGYIIIGNYATVSNPKVTNTAFIGNWIKVRIE